MIAKWKHLAGGIIMYGAVVLTGIGAFLSQGEHPHSGTLLLALGIPLSLLGAYIKKKNCPCHLQDQYSNPPKP